MSIWYRIRKFLGYDHTATEGFASPRYEYKIYDNWGEKIETVEGNFYEEGDGIYEWTGDAWAGTTASPTLSGAIPAVNGFFASVHNDATEKVRDVRENEHVYKKEIGEDEWLVEVDYATEAIVDVSKVFLERPPKER
jgi:hypothetical protein